MWRRAPENPDTRVFVAKGHDRVVGFAAVGPARGSEGDGELYSIYVLPSEWDTGTGRALMDAAVEWLAARFAEAILWVAARNPRARRFYEAGGWVADAERKDIVEGVEVDEVRYRLSGLDRL
jgi:GNAT superfamily N-acetyltransferase